MVAKAFDVLSDSNKRVIHDEGGDADVSRGRSSASSFHQQQYAYSRRQADDVSPEDLFNMFFGGGMRSSFGPGFRQQQQQQQRYRQQQQQQRFRQQQQYQQHFARQQGGRTNGDADLAGSLSQMMPIILIAILAIFAILFSFEGEPLYTFRPNPPSNIKLRSTKSNNINYYVNPKIFDTTVKNNMHKFARTERQIESDWLQELRMSCQSEQRHKANLMAQADGVLFGIVGRNEKAYKKAENMKMKSCDELRRLASKIRG